MNELDEVIETAEKLCSNLDKAALNEKKFCHDVCYELELWAWEIHRIRNNIKEIKEIYGV